MHADRIRIEWLKCSKSLPYFFATYLQLFNATNKQWIPFDLWPGQRPVLTALQQHRQIIILKARQIGMTWLCLGYLLHQIIFRPGSTILLFSRRDNEAMELIGDERLKGMYTRLPAWMHVNAFTTDNAHEWGLSNNSRALAFPTTGGDSFTASHVLVDESDIVPNLGKLLRSVKPTVDNGGQLLLVSRADKDKPTSEFKQIYRAATRGTNEWTPIFLPWSVHPGRTQAWYEAQQTDVWERTGSYDDLYEQYPATHEQALAPRQRDKRLPLAHIEAAAIARANITTQPTATPQPPIPGLTVFTPPQLGRRYVLSADSAEGNPTSDDSVGSVHDRGSWDQVAILAGKIEPATFARDLALVATWYNNAGILPERQNHGHATILALQAIPNTPIINGLDGRPGWSSDERGKVLMYDLVAETLQNNAVYIPCPETRIQLAGIENNTLRAPSGQHDDYADALAIALAACRYGQASSIA